MLHPCRSGVFTTRPSSSGGATFVISEGVNDELKTVQTMTPELDVVDAARQAAAGR